MTVAWVVGARGLLGRALTDRLRQTHTALFSPAHHFVWSDERRLPDQLAPAVAAFAESARDAGGWEIYWSAGISGMDSPEPVLRAETRALQWFVDRLESEPSLRGVPGRFLLSSSAGAIYAGSRESVVDEASPSAPTTPYARGKLEQEELLGRSRLPARGCRILLARIASVYGPALPSDNRRGLITTMARCLVRNEPAPIYVPLDTARDYIDSRDVAHIGIAALRALPRPGDPVVKIVASEKPTTVAELLATFRRIAPRRLLFTSRITTLSSVYSMRFRLRSRVLPVTAGFSSTPLPQGVARVLARERLLAQHPPGCAAPESRP